MRILKIDISNKLTDYGVELFYRKLFDRDTEYDRVFFTDLQTLRKLRLYHRSGYVESDREELSIAEYEYIEIRYYFDSLPPQNYGSIVLEDDGYRRILDLGWQYMTISDTGESNVSCIVCKFAIDRSMNAYNAQREKVSKWIPIVLTDYGNRFVYESLANMRNEKVDFIFTGDGEPDNSPSNFHMIHPLDDTAVQNVLYYDRYCVLMGRKLFPYNIVDLTELGLGFYLVRKKYIKNHVATMDRNWLGNTYPIDRTEEQNPATLEYDHPVFYQRLKDSDYACVWYSGNPNHLEETMFPNLSFSARFYVNILYQILTDEEPMVWQDDQDMTDGES